MRNRLPIDRNRNFRASDYPRKPSAYTPLRHFGQRFRENRRHLDEEVVEACIREGDLRDNEDGCGCFRLEWGEGVAYYLIAGFHERGYRILVTGWPHLHDRKAAMKSGRWSSSELDDIESFNQELNRGFSGKYPNYDEWLKNRFGKQ
jgi:hypothetical protein